MKRSFAVFLARSLAVLGGFFLIVGGALAALGRAPYPALAGLLMIGRGVLIDREDPRGVRAFASVSDKILWKARLSMVARATPMTWRRRDRRRNVVATAGGHGALGTRYGDYTLAFALPRGT